VGAGRLSIAGRAGAAPRTEVGRAGVDQLAGLAPPGGSRPSASFSAARPSPSLRLATISVFHDETSPPPLAPPSPSSGPQQSFRAIRGGAGSSGWAAVDGRLGPGCEPVGARTGRSNRDASRGGA
jgi:hypothetical protein